MQRGRFTVYASPRTLREDLYRHEVRKIMNGKNYYPLTNTEYLRKYGNTHELERFLKPFRNQFEQVNALYGVNNKVKKMIKDQIHGEIRAHIRPHLKKFVKLVTFRNGSTRKSASPFGTPR